MKKETVKKRNTSIELLRIVTMLMIIGCHFATHGGFDFKRLTVPKLWWNLLEMGGDLGVVIFMIISGYFLIKDSSLKIGWRKVIRLWGQIVFYAFVFFLVTYLMHINIDLETILKTAFPIGQELWWFASTYFILYLFHPYLNRLLSFLDRNEYRTLIVSALLIWSILPNIVIASYQLNVLLEFMLYYAVGGYIGTYGLSEETGSRKWLLGFILLTLFKYLLYTVPDLIGFNFSWIAKHFTYVYLRNSFLTVMQGTCLFMAFLRHDFRYSSFINRIASAVFGVYLIHDSPLMRSLLWKDIFSNASYQDTILIIPYSLGVILLVFICCALIDLLRQLTFEKLFMKLMDRIGPSIGRLYRRLTDILTGIIFNDN